MATISTRTRARTRSSARDQDAETPGLEKKNAVKSRKKQSRKRKVKENEDSVAEPNEAQQTDDDKLNSKLTKVTSKTSLPPQEIVREEAQHSINGSDENDKDIKTEQDSETQSQNEQDENQTKTGSSHNDPISASKNVAQIDKSGKVFDKDNKSNTEKHERRKKKKRYADDVIDFSTVDKEELTKAMYGIVKSESFKTSKPKGQPKSGRTWKTERTSRFSEMKKVRPLKTSWEKKMAAKAEKKSIKMYEKQLQESRAVDVQKRKDKKREKMERKRENEKQSEVVQVIKDTAKIKRMKKKQLHLIQKR